MRNMLCMTHTWVRTALAGAACSPVLTLLCAALLPDHAAGNLVPNVSDVAELLAAERCEGVAVQLDVLRSDSTAASMLQATTGATLPASLRGHKCMFKGSLRHREKGNS